MKVKKFVSALAITVAVVAPVAMSAPGFAQTAGTVPQEVKDNVASAKGMITELNGIATAALIVALTPLGAMLTLRFLNMVLSRV